METDDWVYEVVEGDGQAFGMGLDCIECGAVKYLEREGASEYAPYLCWIDYPQFAAMGLRLDRTETIAQGGQRCDFRVSRGEPVHVEPEFLHARVDRCGGSRLTRPATRKERRR